MAYKKRARPTVAECVDGILSGDRILLSKAITLMESQLSDDNELAVEILDQVMGRTGNATRVGITGVPGVGKSTFIESLGKYVTGLDKKLAVLTIDPSSQRSGGSILGDKTRMEQLSHNPMAYIRPSASQNALGGVALKTREVMLLCEAAGYEVIFIETVGVGQSEVAVNDMVDFFLLLMLPGAGDELQGMKKGIMEMADAVAITKSDGDNIKAANRAKAEYQNALHLFPSSESGWYPKVSTCSSIQHTGIKEIWDIIREHETLLKSNQHWNKNRGLQNLQWMHEHINHALRKQFFQKEYVKNELMVIEERVRKGEVSAYRAALDLLKSLHL
ncbi:methylmalonyl Co-A mutase-associated GTPase MeaB [Fulvivirgaceae bacterium BMA10]|uniref:Methylmalonyl Co-A mutase-associated GTPase MeaB n=1 Tax=Splendidivirga corallicola TaxID=3051826 RepID=A0ABT8KRZ8_9BACT|nr:methylmalonyl Co-A mutase-associated GTPase MeaB [Fulvivirgaceae bacterium BMA10]